MKRLCDLEWIPKEGKFYVDVLAVQQAVADIVSAHQSGEDMIISEEKEYPTTTIAGCWKEDRCPTCRAFMKFAKIDEGHLK